MSKQYDRYMAFYKERESYEDKELSLKTEYLAAYIWHQTIEYAKSTGLPTTFDLFIDIWTSFYYCIRDIIRIRGIEYKMQEAFINSTCEVFQIQENERDIFPSILQYQNALLRDLSKEVSSPRTKEGFISIYKNLLFLVELGTDDKTFVPDALNEFEFIIAATAIVEYAASTFSNTKSSTNAPSKHASKESPLNSPISRTTDLHSSSPIPDEEETDSLNDVLFICFWVIVPILIIALLL